MIRIRRGLDLPITGEPSQHIGEGGRAQRVGILGADYLGLKPSLLVSEGARVKRGEALIADRRFDAVQITSPCAGTVLAIHRGERRAFISLEISRDTTSDATTEDHLTFARCTDAELAQLPREDVRANLLASGLWTALRTRPFDKLPNPATIPHAIFVNAMDTNPLAADVDVVMAGRESVFRTGVLALTRLTDGNVYVCRSPRSRMPRITDIARVVEAEFDGPHPSGLVGTHIHFLAPVGARRTVWHLNHQDAIAIGTLFSTGELDATRIVSLCGPQVRQPRLLRTVLGASTNDLTRGELQEGDNRIVSGSVLHGAPCTGNVAYLGRYAQQVTVLREGRERELLRYVRPGFNMHSVSNAVLGKFLGVRIPFTTTTNGSARAMVPIGSYEAVMPLDIQPTFLLRYLIVGDTERAAQLGALELGEEDLALCTYACPGKYEYGPILRDVLDRIEQEG